MIAFEFYDDDDYNQPGTISIIFVKEEIELDIRKFYILRDSKRNFKKVFSELYKRIDL